jgi:hypothetical protein
MKIEIDGYSILIDDEDIEIISLKKWKVEKNIKSNLYYVRTISEKNIYMHKYLLSCPIGMEVDHIDGNGLNNKKENLRIATHQQNNFNKKPYANNKVGLKGVREDRGKFIATITHNYKTIYIGSYKTKEEAGIAYDKKALECFGDFAYLNYPEKRNFYEQN